MKEFFNKFENLKSSSFIGIKNYCNKYGEVSNLSVLTNVSVETAKKKDLATLKSLTEDDLKDIATAQNLPFETLKTALSEMINSAERNLGDFEKRSNQSKAQSDAYVKLTPAIKLHKDTLNLYVTGFINSKSVLVEGTYPTVNKRVKTLCKEAISKHCDLRMSKFRTYMLGSMDKINITGSTLQINS